MRVGELRQQGQAGGGAQMGKGVVCEVEWGGGDDCDEEEEEEEEREERRRVIRGFWDGLGTAEKGTKEFFGRPVLDEGGGEVRGRLWLEALRTRF